MDVAHPLTVSHLPPELITHILEALVHDLQHPRKRREAIYAVARTSRLFYGQSRPFLFEDIFFYGHANSKLWDSQIKLLRLLASDRQLAAYVKVLGLQFDYIPYVEEEDEEDEEGHIGSAPRPSFLASLYALFARATRNMSNLRMYDGDSFSFLWNQTPSELMSYVHLHDYLCWTPELNTWFASRPRIHKLYIEPHPRRDSLVPVDPIFPSCHPTADVLPNLRKLEGFLSTSSLDDLVYFCRGRPIQELSLSGIDARPSVPDLRALGDLVQALATNEAADLRSLTIDNIGHDSLPSFLLRPFVTPIYTVSFLPASLTRHLEELCIDISHSLDADFRGPQDSRWDPELIRLLRGGAFHALKHLIFEMGLPIPCTPQSALAAEPLRTTLLAELPLKGKFESLLQRSPAPPTASTLSDIDDSPLLHPISDHHDPSTFSDILSEETPTQSPKTAAEPGLDILVTCPALERVRVPGAWLLKRSPWCPASGHAASWTTVVLSRPAEKTEEEKLKYEDKSAGDDIRSEVSSSETIQVIQGVEG